MYRASEKEKKIVSADRKKVVKKDGLLYLLRTTHTKLVRGFGNAGTAASGQNMFEPLARCAEGMLEAETSHLKC